MRPRVTVGQPFPLPFKPPVKGAFAGSLVGVWYAMMLASILFVAPAVSAALPTPDASFDQDPPMISFAQGYLVQRNCQGNATTCTIGGNNRLGTGTSSALAEGALGFAGDPASPDFRTLVQSSGSGLTGTLMFEPEGAALETLTGTFRTYALSGAAIEAMLFQIEGQGWVLSGTSYDVLVVIPSQPSRTYGPNRNNVTGTVIGSSQGSTQALTMTEVAERLDVNGLQLFSSVTLEPDASPAADGEDVATVTVTVRSWESRALSNQTVSLQNSTGGESSPAAQTALTDEDGVATFQIASTVAGTVTYQASVDLGGDTIHVGDPIEITFKAGPPSQLRLVQQPSEVVASGASFPTQPSVRLLDVTGNMVAQGEVEVTVSIASGAGALGGTVTVMTSEDGEATFTDLSILGLVGERTLSFSAPDLVADTSHVIVVTAGAASQLVMLQEPSEVVASGASFGTQPSVRLLDVSENVVAQAGVEVTAAIDSGGGTLQGTVTTTTDEEGVATFTDLSILGLVGERTLSFSAADLTTVTSANMEVTAGAASQLAMLTQPSPTAQTGVVFADQPAVQLRDASGNVVSESGTEVSVAIATGEDTLGGTLSAMTDSNGVATFSGLVIAGSVGIRTLNFSATDLEAATSDAISITAGPPAQLELMSGMSSTGTVGEDLAITPSVRVVDAYGNPVSDALVTFEVEEGSGSAEPAVAIESSAAGLASLTRWTLGTQPGTHQVRAAVDGSEPVIDLAISVTALPGAPDAATSTFEFDQGQNPVADGSSIASFSLHLRDRLGNPLSGVAVSFQLADGHQGTLSDGPWVTDADGRVTATLTSTTEGSVTVLASVGSSLAAVTSSFGSASVTFNSGIVAPLETVGPDEIELKFAAAYLAPRQCSGRSTVCTASGNDGGQSTELVADDLSFITSSTNGTFSGSLASSNSDLAGRVAFNIAETQVEGRFRRRALNGNGVIEALLFEIQGTGLVLEGVSHDLWLVIPDDSERTYGPNVSNLRTLSSSNTGSVLALALDQAGITVFSTIAAEPEADVVADLDDYATVTVTVTTWEDQLLEGFVVELVDASESGSTINAQSATTNEDGVATFRVLHSVAGTTEYRATVTIPGPSTGTASATLSSTTQVDFVAGPAFQLALAQEADGSEYGQPFATQPIVLVQDQFGNLVLPDDSSVVSVEASEGADVIGTTDVVATGGVATFVDAGLEALELVPYTLTFRSGALIPVSHLLTPLTSLPSAPLVLTGDPGDASAQVEWSVPPSSGGSPTLGYVMEYRETLPNGDTLWTRVGPVPDRRLSVWGLANERRHDFRVATVTAIGMGPFSNPVLQLTPRAPVLAPTGETPAPDLGDAVETVDGQETPLQLEVVEETRLQLSGSDFTLSLEAKDATGTSVTMESTDPVIRLREQGSVRTQGEGFEPGSEASIWIFSEPQFLGNLPVNEEGAFEGELPLPPDLAFGRHSIQVVGRTVDGERRSATVGVLLEAAEPLSAPQALRGQAGDQSVALAWDLPMFDGGLAIEAYVVEYRSRDGDWIRAGPFFESSAILEGLDNGRPYQFRVAAQAAGTRGPFSTPPLSLIPNGPITGVDGSLEVVGPGEAVHARSGERLPLTLSVHDETAVRAEGSDFMVQLGVKDLSGDPVATREGGPILRLPDAGFLATQGEGFEPFTQVAVWLYHEFTVLGYLDVDAQGRFEGEFPVPPNLPLGAYTLQISGLDRSGRPQAAMVGVLREGEEDLRIAVETSNATPAFGEQIVLTVRVANAGLTTVLDVIANPALDGLRLLVLEATPSQGVWDQASGQWQIGTMMPSQMVTLTLRALVTRIELEDGQ